MGSIHSGTAIAVVCLVAAIPMLFSSDTGCVGCLGVFLVGCGILGVLYFTFAFDTSVTTNGVVVGGQAYGGGMRVNNIGLLADRQNGLLVSIGAAVVGTILLVAGYRQSAPQLRQSPQAMRACPSCGVSRASWAAYCPNCGREIGVASPATKLANLEALKKQGLLTDEEFRQASAKVSGDKI